MGYRSYGAFKDVHPSGTGRQPLGTLKGIDLPPDAMRGSAKPNESRWIRCWQCGFPVDTERHNLNMQEPAITFPTTTVTPNDQDAVATQDARVSDGCPFCGASESAYRGHQ